MDRAQLLDRLPVERERGITVKAQSASLFHKEFLLNLVDTPVSWLSVRCWFLLLPIQLVKPAFGTVFFLSNFCDCSFQGHVDFNFEVQRSLAACQSVVLLIDANEVREKFRLKDEVENSRFCFSTKQL